MSGDAQKFREQYWQKAGVNGGLADFGLTEKISPGVKLALDGHALPDDYKVSFFLSRNDLGFIRSGWEQYRKYYDGTGGYFPGSARRRPAWAAICIWISERPGWISASPSALAANGFGL